MEGLPARAALLVATGTLRIEVRFAFTPSDPEEEKMSAPSVHLDHRDRERDYTVIIVAGIVAALLIIGVFAFTTTSDRPLVSADPRPETTGRSERAPAPRPPSA